MPANTSIEIPLQQAFMEMMKLEAGQARKGIDLESYFLLIDTLKKGYGLNSKEDLFFLCRKLWLKPFHRGNHTINEQALEEVLERNLKLYATSDIEIADTNQEDHGATAQQPGADNADKESKAPLKERTQDEGTSNTTGLQEAPVQQEGDLYLYISQESDQEAANTRDNNYRHLFPDKQYSLDNRYLPLSRRFIEQTIRSLRYRVKGIGRPVMDVAATVKEVARKGYFEDWQTEEEDGFVTKWTLLIDHQGSMAAFQDLSDALVQSATAGSFRNEGDVFYFRNYPLDYLYTNPRHTRSIRLAKLAAAAPRNILILSDAGAARGYYNEERVRNTFGLLYRFRNHRIAWLNPIPKARWKGTSAEEISTFVQMFETGTDTSDDMGSLVLFFKAKTSPQIQTNA